MTRRQHLLFGIVTVLGAAIGCARHARPAVDPDAARIERLFGSAFGVLQTGGLSHAFAMPACGPTDDPAVALYLLDAPSDAIPPTTRHTRVTIVREVDELARQTFKWDSSRGPGDGELCSAGSCAAMKAGRITFGDVS